MSISGNLRDDEWELGVLRYLLRFLSLSYYRAIGLKKRDITKVMLFESIAGITSSTLLGFLVGIISAVAMTALFMAIVELPFTLIVSHITLTHYIAQWPINNHDAADDLNYYQCWHLDWYVVD